MSFRNLSIKRKLTLITMSVSTIALLIASASFLVYDLVSFRAFLIEDLSTQAQIIGGNSAAALAFSDASAGRETLAALKAKEDVVAAVLYRVDGKPFAEYVREGAHFSRPAAGNSSYLGFGHDRLTVAQDVSLRGERVGRLYLESDLRQWNARVTRYVVVLFLCVLIAIFLAWFVSSRLQPLIARPILQLEETMHSVSSDRNYSLRANKVYDDEIGSLIDGFNAMLSEIQDRDAALQGANAELKTRTLELEEEIVQHENTQKELLQSKKAAEDASRAKSSFLANMSHELRTPLNAIIGYSEMLAEESQEFGNTKVVQDLKKIQASGKHLLALINDVLDLSKIEAGKMVLHLEVCEVSPLIEEMLPALQTMARKNFNEFRVNVSPNAGTFCVDRTHLGQILLNLLGNAFKFTQRGVVTLNVNRISADTHEWLEFCVTDTGIGIGPEQRKTLFKEFGQADASISRCYGGTGLGLAICDRFVHLMGGRIDLQSEKGQGSTFTVVLPADLQAQTLEQSNPAPGSDPDTQKIKTSNSNTILVIDDDPKARELLSRLLVKLGLEVIEAANGTEGLRLARTIQPAAITLDVLMPDMTGWRVLEDLKRGPSTTSIPVIMVSVVDKDIVSKEAAGLQYLQKPVSRDHLISVLGNYVSTGPACEGTLDGLPQ